MQQPITACMHTVAPPTPANLTLRARLSDAVGWRVIRQPKPNRSGSRRSQPFSLRSNEESIIPSDMLSELCKRVDANKMNEKRLVNR